MPNNYIEEKFLGAGKFGKVWLVKSTINRQPCVLKEIPMDSINSRQSRSPLNEVLILSKCNHRNIIRYIEASIDENRRTLTIKMEYAEGGDLSAAIKNQRGIYFTEKRILTWFIQMSLGLQYIHHQKILHRDLKPENILLTRHREIKIGDFGIARILKDQQDLANTIVGTPNYLSPEICQKKPYSFESDIWALGCILFEMASLSKVFQAKDFFHLISLILKGERNELPRHCSPMLRNLVKSLLSNDPEKRPRIADILQYPGLQPYMPAYANNYECYAGATYALRNNVVKRTNYVRKNIRDTCKRKISDVGTVKRLRIVGPRLIQKNKENRNSISSLQDLSRATYNVPSPEPSTSENSGMSSTYKIMAQLTRSHKKAKHSLTSSHDPRTPRLSAGNQYDLSETRSRKFLKSDSDVLDDVPFERSKFSESDTFRFEPTPDTCSTSFFPGRDCSTKKSDEGVFSARSSHGAFGSQPSDFHLHSQCSHSQCHQCMLNTFWRNRIRGNSEGLLNAEELKTKLASVFSDEFDHVYQTLFDDWDKSDSGKTALQKLEGKLSYEQTQNLPLMMQLIQLDILKASKF